MIKEFILCAAINYNGSIVCGHRHSTCYEILQKLTGLSDDDLPQREDQGFLTSLNRFVDRKEAFKIAKGNDQIFHKMFDDVDEGILASEDLY